MRTFTRQVSQSAQPVALRLSPAQLALFAASWPAGSSRKVIVTDRPAAAVRELLAALQGWSDALGVNDSWHWLTGELTEQERFGHIATSLSCAYHALLGHAPAAHFIIPAALLAAAVPSSTAYRKNAVAVAVGERHTLSRLVARLARAGYRRSHAPGEPGTFAVSGESLTVAHPATAECHTVTLWHDTIERLARAAAPRRLSQQPQLLRSLTLPAPAFPQSSLPLSQALVETCIMRPSHHLIPTSRCSVVYDALHPHLDFPFRDSPDRERALQRPHIWLIFQNRDRAARLARRAGTDVLSCQHDLSRVPICLTSGESAIISETSLTPRDRSPAPISYRRSRELISDLSAGRPAVHSDHGIGIFEGLFRQTYGTVTREYLVLRYAAGDSLAVPVEYAHKVTPYIGVATPVIHRLHTAAWLKTKRAARENALQFARDLLAIAARREAATRPAYRIDEGREAALAESFPFTLTDSQVQAWRDVQRDLASRAPMDRLIVGDVGFGKTEIALRAACHVAGSGAQVAVLSPTTLLAEQHARVFQQRLPALAARIATFSRLTPARERATMRSRLARGDVTIAIGTHALLSPRLTWRNLRLVIIDEEQRFGVSHKEHFKKMRANIDVLSLSATPIPRTLSMALSGLKHISLINDPPPGRLAINTYVGPDSDATIRQAVAQELKRGGQVFVVAPRIRHLVALAHRLRALAPQAKLAVAHGRLPSQELTRTLGDFAAGVIHILISSSIIESGLDLPRTNTLIVLNATHFGLADLYQLRGRIGRRSEQGFSYFLYDQHELSQLQRQRLAALTEAAQLGSGWALAQRDLELRGAGNLLGAEQSGAVSTIGLQLYLDMIRDTSRSHGPVHPHDVDIQLPISAHLPAAYIADSAERTLAYQNLSRATTRGELDAQRRALERHFGPLPPPARNLCHLLELQHTAAAADLQVITSRTVNPPRAVAFQRLSVTAAQPHRALAKLGALGTWRVQDNTFTLDVPAITPALVQKMIRVLD